jgi:hypothetical protein
VTETAGFRDLNGNGRLDPYEDQTRPVEERVEDLLAQMTLEEKAGLMFHPPVLMNPDGTLIGEDTVSARSLNHFNIYFAPGARLLAEWHNSLQRLAEATRLGIPVTISSDPRHSFDENAVGRAGRPLAPSPSGPSRSASRRRATRSSCAPSARSPARSTAPSASTSRSTRWPMWPPSRAGRASAARSARTSSWSAG